MSKTLVIVESPTKAKSIGKFLGRNFSVKSSMGHIRDLPKSQLGVDVEQDFQPKYITIRGKGETLKELKESAKKADKVLLAADPDREGEAIAWHLSTYLELKDSENCRIEFNEITKPAIQAAVKKPRPIDMDRVNAQQARRVLDRLVGYKLSPLLWKKVKKGLSAGRVQSVAVRLICDRETEIEQFVPEEYWSLTGDFDTGTQALTAKLFKIGTEKASIPDQEAMDRILAGLKGLDYLVDSISKKDKKRNPSPPFTTSSLQQEAYRKLGFTARKTMQLAQQLYEGLDVGEEGAVGLITYIRTDSTRLSETAQQDARDLIKNKYGDRFVPETIRQYEAKGKIQNAHEAIRPTSVYRTPELVKAFLKPPQYKLYKLIWERFVASQMSGALLEVTTVDIHAGEYVFRASGTVIQFPGFMQVYIEGKDDDTKEDDDIIPQVTEGQTLQLEKLTPKQHFTQPLPRYSEATLVKTLEEKGIGRPSTYAPIIDTILARGYVVRQEKQFTPTELGKIVVDLLKEYFPKIIDVEFTAGMEQELDLVEEGSIAWKQVIGEFYHPFQKTLEYAEEQIGHIEIEDEESDEVCEKCGRKMVYKMGRFGKFLACPGFPECRNAKPILKEIGVKCPECGGEIIERKGKKGRTFFGCSNYPACQYVSWDKPTGEVCPQCGTLMVEKAGRNKEKTVVCPKCK
ncbi:type I DNA topoisomerase [Candidatus Formimonas warabiya]|uniref:DNA topoisomerase 1 n=1 Tax=Formimonas warabiya TaxID=1761012 RepID=A0A3G1KQ29_FORW1|nr:type I DNA topoisomerase [Candidatus Formimonas warabiya]ATW24548.1 DNA topoisomerase I [Candidatus Formimonas warabiya]